MSLARVDQLFAGELRNRIAIQRNLPIQSATGELSDNWEDFLKAWCSIEQGKSIEIYAGDTRYPEADSQITMRYRGGIDSTMRVLWKRASGDRLFDIVGVDDVNQRHHVLELACKERPVKRNT